MILQRVYAPKTVVLTVAVACVSGFHPIAGLKEDVEKKWKKLKAKAGLVENKMRAKYSPDRSSSASQLDRHAKLQQRRHSDMALTLAKFKEIDAAAHRAAETDDVFSPLWKPPKFDKNDPEYGRPRQGSLTEQRGIAAGMHIAKEIIHLCEVISENGRRNKDDTVTITFGRLFAIYVYISDKVVGMLLRARKHGIVEFEGEMLFQRRDEDVPITLLKSVDAVQAVYEQSMDPARCLTNVD